MIGPARPRARLLGAVGALTLAAAGVSACGSGPSTPAAESPTPPTTITPSASATGSGPVRDAPAQLILRPPIGQDKDGKPQTPGVATFNPAKPGAKVTVQRGSGSGWTTVTTGVQDETGAFAFRVPAADAADAPSYRATSDSGNGPVTSMPTNSSPWQQVWSDDFAGDTLRKDWSLVPTGPFAGRSCSTATTDMGTTGDGYAAITAAIDPSKTPAVDAKTCPIGRLFNAQFGTEKSHTFTYGVFAARLKYEHAEGMHASFWMLPGGQGPANPAPDNPGQTGVEVDVTEYFGDDFGPGTGNGDYHAYVYWPQRQTDGSIKSVKTGGAQGFTTHYPGSQPSDGYHVYSVEWTPTEYIFRLDGVETSRLTVGISQRPEYLLLSQLTSDWEVPKLTRDHLPASMSVDWVRAWQE